MSATLTGIGSTRTALRSAQRRRSAAILGTVTRHTGEVAREAKGFAPVDDGDLRESIHAVPPEAGGPRYVGRVKAEADHAPYVEFGTGVHVTIPEGQEAYARQFYVNGEGRTEAQPFLFPAVEAIRAGFVRDVNRAADTGTDR
ncbi:MAG: HK97 gp10 family phage protein [Pseudoalteromonas tetraodonis]